NAPRGVADRRPLVDRGAGRPPLLRPRARNRRERRRLPRQRERHVVHAESVIDARFPLGGPRGSDRATAVVTPRPRAQYVELHAHSAYSFLDGVSLPEELAARAAELGYDALALTDHDGVYGSLEFAYACKHFGVRAITGAEVTLAGDAHVTLLCESQRGYANLCRILTDAHAGT